jgi:hypothetical protein
MRCAAPKKPEQKMGAKIRGSQGKLGWSRGSVGRETQEGKKPERVDALRAEIGPEG